MRITVFGASGKTGRHVVERALAGGHSVTAVTYKGVIDPRPNLTVTFGNVLDAASVVDVLRGSDAVICSIGPQNNFSPGLLMSEGARNIIEGCKASGCSRMIFQSGITISYGEELSLLNRIAVRIIQRIYAKVNDDKKAAERIVQTSGLEWVIVRPAGMRDSPPTYTYKAGPKARIAPLRPLSFADCADCLVRAATEKDWINQIVNVGRS